MSVRIKSVEIKEFLEKGNISIDFSKDGDPGIYLVTGPIESGKSTLMRILENLAASHVVWDYECFEGPDEIIPFDTATMKFSNGNSIFMSFHIHNKRAYVVPSYNNEHGEWLIDCNVRANRHPQTYYHLTTPQQKEIIGLVNEYFDKLDWKFKLTKIPNTESRYMLSYGHKDVYECYEKLSIGQQNVVQIMHAIIMMQECMSITDVLFIDDFEMGLTEEKQLIILDAVKKLSLSNAQVIISSKSQTIIDQFPDDVMTITEMF